MATAWKGTLSFGLVNIPVTLASAFKSKELEFHLLHKKDGGPSHSGKDEEQPSAERRHRRRKAG